MRLAAVEARFPDQVVSNTDVVEAVRERAQDVFRGDLARTLETATSLLDASGARTRRWGASGHERRQLTLADASGCHSADAFDVLDACASWIRAIHLVTRLFDTSGPTNAVVVTSEFHGSGDSRVTVGDCATATVVVPDGPDWTWSKISTPHRARLCTLSHDPSSAWIDALGLPADLAPSTFVSHGKALHKEGRDDLLRAMNELAADQQRARVLIPHTTQEPFWREAAAEAGVTTPGHYIFEHAGNVVSSSLPAGLAAARAGGLLSPGEDALLWMAAAGMSFWAAQGAI